MSIDVFGRKLGRTEGSRGPPGIGYKLTKDGQYDIDQKRLCNVAVPNQSSDAVNLETLQRFVRSEISSVILITTGIRTELDNLDAIIEAHRDELDAKLLRLSEDLDNIRELIQSNGSQSRSS